MSFPADFVAVERERIRAEYDFAVNNPHNPHLRRGNRKELEQQLFPTLRGRIRPVTLARWVAQRSWSLATALSSIPLLRTHLPAVLVKREGRDRQAKCLPSIGSRTSQCVD